MKPTIEATMRRIEAQAGNLAALAMLIMVLSVTLDVFMRYTLNAPLTWSYDLVTMYLLPAVVFPPLAMVQQQGHHINVDLFCRNFRPTLKRAAATISLVGAGLVMTAIGWLAAGKAAIAWQENEVVSGPIAWPVWIGPAILAFGAALFVLRVALALIAVSRGEIPSQFDSGNSEAIDAGAPDQGGTR